MPKALLGRKYIQYIVAVMVIMIRLYGREIGFMLICSEIIILNYCDFLVFLAAIIELFHR